MTPRVVVLLATFNGMPWLPDQVATILDQNGVDVRVVVRDDGSTDGTLEWIRAHPQLELLPSVAPTGRAAGNFYELIEHAALGEAQFVALADQDDLWMPGKLARHAAMLHDRALVGVSSNVVSFDDSGRERLIRKDFPQRELDFLLESPGPGSTFLMTRDFVEKARAVLVKDPDAREIDYHDWLLYALARAWGDGWWIDDAPTVRYRQHDANAIGANVGARSALSRLRLVRRGWHREQALRLSGLGMAHCGADLARVQALLEGTGLRSRIALARLAPKLRRRPRDRAIIAALVLTGNW